jgi:uncharacterized protein YaaN involved in tellurite resistance
MELSRESILDFLKSIVESKTFEYEKIKEFQNTIFNTEKIPVREEIEELIRELTYDLDYYEPDEAARNESPSFIDEKGVLELIGEAVRKIELLKNV